MVLWHHGGFVDVFFVFSFFLAQYTAAFGEVTMAWTLVSISGGTSLQHLGSNAAAADLNISAAIELASTNINTLSSYVNSISVAIPVVVVPSSARTTSIPGSARVASKMTPISSRRAIASATSKFISFAHFRVEIIDTGIGRVLLFSNQTNYKIMYGFTNTVFYIVNF